MNEGKNIREYTMCLECLGSGSVFNGLEDYWRCKTCKGSGEATNAENECFLSTTIINN